MSVGLLFLLGFGVALSRRNKKKPCCTGCADSTGCDGKAEDMDDEDSSTTWDDDDYRLVDHGPGKPPSQRFTCWDKNLQAFVKVESCYLNGLGNDDE